MAGKSAYDSVYLHCRKEAWAIFLIWLVLSSFCIVGSYLYGYSSHESAANSLGPAVEDLAGPLSSFDRTPESLYFPLNLGIPDWVFYAIVLPWLLSVLITWFFCVFVMKDDPLEAESEATGSGDRTIND